MSLLVRRPGTGTTVLRLGASTVRVEPRPVLVGIGLALLTLAVAVISLSFGTYAVSPPDVVRTLVGDGTPIQEFIVETVRLPRTVNGLLVGAALGVGGAVFQSVSRNPLGSPDVVGFDTGAATGALIVLLVLHGSVNATAVGAVVGGLVTALLVYTLAMKRGVQGYRLILVGIGIAALLQSVNSYLLTRSRVQEAQAATAWLTGSLNGRGWPEVRTVTIALVLLVPLACLLGRQLRVLEAGDDVAGTLGIQPERVRLGGVLVGVGMSAAATAAAGPIVFVALTAPQLARRLTRAPGPNVLPSALMGSVLLGGSDIVAQHLFPSQLPVGVVTGVLGGIYLAWLLGRESRKGRG